VVEAIRARILALPEVALEGGVHVSIFLREPVVLQCLAERRAYRDHCLAVQHIVARSVLAAPDDDHQAMAMSAMPICVPPQS